MKGESSEQNPNLRRGAMHRISDAIIQKCRNDDWHCGEEWNDPGFSDYAESAEFALTRFEFPPRFEDWGEQ